MEEESDIIEATKKTIENLLNEVDCFKIETTDTVLLHHQIDEFQEIQKQTQQEIQENFNFNLSDIEITTVYDQQAQQEAQEEALQEIQKNFDFVSSDSKLIHISVPPKSVLTIKINNKPHRYNFGYMAPDFGESGFQNILLTEGTKINDFTHNSLEKVMSNKNNWIDEEKELPKILNKIRGCDPL